MNCQQSFWLYLDAFQLCEGWEAQKLILGKILKIVVRLIAYFLLMEVVSFRVTLQNLSLEIDFGSVCRYLKVHDLVAAVKFSY